MSMSIKCDIAEVVGYVISVCINTTYIETGAAHHSAAGYGYIAAVADLTELVDLKEHTFCEFLNQLAGSGAFLNALLVNVSEYLIEAAVGNTVTVCFDYNHIGGYVPKLHGFPNIAGDTFCYVVAIGCNALKFLFALGVGLNSSHFLCLGGDRGAGSGAAFQDLLPAQAH